MENNTIENKNDFTGNWASSSRFLYYLSIFCFLSFVLGACYHLYDHRYKGKPEVVVPDNTLYDPKYK